MEGKVWVIKGIYLKNREKRDNSDLKGTENDMLFIYINLYLIFFLLIGRKTILL